MHDWNEVIHWDMPDGYSLKWDPYRRTHKWTASGHEYRLGDFNSRSSAMRAIEAASMSVQASYEEAPKEQLLLV